MTYRDIEAETFVDFPLEWGNRLRVDGLFRIAGIERTVAFEVRSVDVALDLVAQGNCLAFVPRQAIANRVGVVEVDLVDPPPRVDLGLVRSTGGRSAPATSSLYEFIVSSSDLHDVLLG